MPHSNIILVLTDDQGVWAAGCYGNREIRTPNMDRLAASGMRFNHFFCASPVCSPSRATLLTGRIPSQHGVHDWIRDADVGPGALRFMQRETTYTDILARAGWTCSLSGKWHLGDSQVPQNGFTDWYAHQRGGGDYRAFPMVRDGQLVTEHGYVTDAITDEAIRQLDRHAAAGRRFYLSVHYTAPHSPWIGQHPQDIVESYDDCPFQSCPQEPRHPWAIWLTDENLGKRESLKGYFAAVTAMDRGLGRILDRVEALGLRESTLIIFLSDNGFSCGHHGFWGKGNGTNPRNLYENSIRVPAIFSQPGVIPQGRVEDALVSGCDFMPTLLDMQSLPLPTDRNLPGASFAPLLKGQPAPERESVVIFDEYGPVRMIRTREWKFVYRHAYGPHELFHLTEDPGERRNLAGDPAHAKRMADLRGQMDEWFARYVEPDTDGLRQPGGDSGQPRFAWQA